MANSDFYETNAAAELAQAYQDQNHEQHRYDWLFLICLFFTLDI